VSAGFAHFVDRAIEATAAEFSVGRALRGTDGPTTRLIDGIANSDTLHERLVEPELAAYREQVIGQFETLLDAVESDDPLPAHREAILERDAFLDALRSDLPAERRAAIADDVFAHHAGLGRAVEPLVSAEADDFWRAAEQSLDPSSARELVRERFVFTAPLRDHPRAFRFATTIDPGIEVEFTEEAVRAMRRAERQVVAETLAEVDERFA
jgi:hypothetical protein